MAYPFVPFDGYFMFGVETVHGEAASEGHYVGVCNMPRTRIESGLAAIRSIGDWRPILLKGGPAAAEGRVRFQPQAGDSYGLDFLQAAIRGAHGANRGRLPSLTLETGISNEMYSQAVGCKMRQLGLNFSESEPLICEASWQALDEQWFPLGSEKYQTFAATPDVYFWYEGYFDLAGEDISLMLSQVRLDVTHTLRRPYVLGTGATSIPRGPYGVYATSQTVRGTIRTYGYLEDDMGAACLPDYANIIVHCVSACTGEHLYVNIDHGKWRWKEGQELSPEQLKLFGAEFEAIDVGIHS